jgi:hypothetical protein
LLFVPGRHEVLQSVTHQILWRLEERQQNFIVETQGLFIAGEVAVKRLIAIRDAIVSTHRQSLTTSVLLY